VANTAELYTIGYEGKAVQGFVEDLVRNGIEVLVDVRELPVSRKPGFSKSKLRERVASSGIDYLHLRSLGSPRESRKRLRQSGDSEGFSKEYLNHLEGSSEDFDALKDLIGSGKRAALMCFEQDHQRCHRTLLVSELMRSAGIDVRPYHI